MTIAIRAIRLRSAFFGKVIKSLSIKIVKSCKRYRTDIIQRIKPTVLHNNSNNNAYNPNKRGHLYIAFNVYSPYVVKVGVSHVGYISRFTSLYTTGVPDHFQPVMVMAFDDATHVETILHNEFAEYRSHMGREFFGHDADKYYMPDNDSIAKAETLKQKICKKFWDLAKKYEGHLVVNNQSKALTSYLPVHQTKVFNTKNPKERKIREPKNTQKPKERKIREPRKTRQPKKIRENPRT